MKTIRNIAILAAIAAAALSAAALSAAAQTDEVQAVQYPSAASQVPVSNLQEKLLDMLPSVASQIQVSNLEEKLLAGEVLPSPLYAYDNSRTGDGRPAIMQVWYCLNCRADL